jgi:hypothetical protein
MGICVAWGNAYVGRCLDLVDIDGAPSKVKVVACVLLVPGWLAGGGSEVVRFYNHEFQTAGESQIYLHTMLAH